MHRPAWRELLRSSEHADDEADWTAAGALHMTAAMAKRRPGAERARWAAAQPNRPGEECKAAPGTWRPVVDHNRCEGKRDCVEVCPYDVFEVRTIDDADYRQLSWVGTLKSWAHGWQLAYTPRAAHCQACGMCVVACPEKAITLEANRQGAKR